MIVKLTSEQVKLIGATDNSDFAAKFVAFVQEANEIKAMAEQSPDFSAIEKRLKALEDKPALTEAQVKTIAATEAKAVVGNDETKALIKTEATAAASAKAVEVMGSTGTTPVKPSPAPGAETSVRDLIAAGKYEEAFAADKNLQAEFITAKGYALFMKAANEGRVAIPTKR